LRRQKKTPTKCMAANCSYPITTNHNHWDCE